MNKIKIIPAEKFEPVSFDESLKEALKDPEFRKAYDALDVEFSIIEQVIRKRLEKGLSQKQLAEKIGTKQSAIARLEGGNTNPTVNFLEKVSKALGSKLQISI
jgi:ribosome-binding protein aMBF1 (putative translation factor)